jgi:rhodanese-related sulfurtransferase
MKANLFLALLPLLAGISCSQAQVSESDFHTMLEGLYRYTVPQVRTTDLAGLSNSDPLFLDTREPEEYAISHIPGARCVGFDDVDLGTVKDLPRDQPIVVYCSVGYRSERIGEKLQEMGFTEVKNLYGGIFDWMQQGQPVVDAEGKPTMNIHTYNRSWSKWAFTGNKMW